MKVTGHLTDSYQIKMNINGYPYIADQSVEKGGEGSGISPHGYLLGSIASCKLMVAKGYLAHNNISYDRVEITGNSEIKGMKRRETIDIDVHITVYGGNLDAKQLDFMTRIVDKGCTMANILTAGGENNVTATVVNG